MITPTAILALGSRGKEVVALHQYLRRFGYLPMAGEQAVNLDGVLVVRASPADDDTFDQATMEAVRWFQRAQGLEETGVVDGPTRRLWNTPRCGCLDSHEPPPGVLRTHWERQGNRWPYAYLSYSLNNTPAGIDSREVRQVLRLAFDEWARVTPLCFQEYSHPADVRIAWHAGAHGDGNPFDGPGKTLAHAFYPPPNGGAIAGDIHFDSSESWAIDWKKGGIDLRTIALHEIGHSLGLRHSRDPRSVMYAYYSGGARHTLTQDDVDGIQAIYSSAVPGITAAVRHPNGRAYFFRGSRYQRYDFRPDRVDKTARIGIDGWKGLWRGGIDAAVMHPNGKAYFFQGSHYQRFDFRSDRVDKTARIDIDGWRGLWKDGIDAAVMHPNGKAYFFRGDQYQRFDFRADRVDKTARINIDGWKGLWTGGVDAAVTHPNGKVYFFRGKQYKRFDFKSDRVDKTARLGFHGWWGLA